MLLIFDAVFIWKVKLVFAVGIFGKNALFLGFNSCIKPNYLHKTDLKDLSKICPAL